MSRLYEGDTIITVFPNVVKAISQSVDMVKDDRFLTDSLIAPDTEDTIENIAEDDISDGVVSAKRTAQASESNVKFVNDIV